MRPHSRRDASWRSTIGGRAVPGRLSRSLTVRGGALLMTALLFLAMVMNFFDRSVVGLAAPELMKHLGLTAEDYGVLASAFYGVYAISGILVGLFVAHRLRPRILITILLAIWTVTQIPVVAFPSFAVLIMCRVVLGAAESPAVATAIAAVHEWFPPERRGVPTAIVLMGTMVGAMIAPPLLTAFIQDHGWQSGFGVCAALSGILLVAMILLGRDGPDVVTAQPHAETGSAPSRIGWRIWCDPMVIGIILVGSSAYWMTSFSVAWLFPMIRLGLGFEAETAGWVVFGIYVANAVTLLTFSFLFERAVARRISSRRAIVTPIILCLAVGAAALASVGMLDQPTFQLPLLATGTALMLPVAGAMPLLISEIAPRQHRNRLLVVLLSATSLSGMVAPYVAGLAIGDGTMRGYAAALDIAAMVLAAGALFAWLLLHPREAARRLARAAGQEVEEIDPE